MKNQLFLFLTSCTLFSSCFNDSTFIRYTYPNGNYKALIMSYDDGVIQDIELAKLFDDNGIVGTFNLNSAYLGTTRGWAQQYGDSVFQKYISQDALLTVYKNHEIAAHGAYHKDFKNSTDSEILDEVNTDIAVLTELTKREIKSMAYPFGNTSEHIAQVVATTKITNARTVGDTHKFGLPTNYLIWHPTCHDSVVLDYIDEYLKKDSTDLSLFYVWGHAWEFDDKKRWENLVTFCQQIGNRDDIWYVGTGEYTDYLKAVEKVELRENEIFNPAANTSVWIETSVGLKVLKPGETIKR